MNKRLPAVAGAILGIAILLAGGFYIYLGSFNPAYNLTLKAPGLKETVIIERNRYAVPTITAQHDDDLYFAWGYANAQDRIFQMEITRRISQGRISEFAGESELKKDIFLRAMGFYEMAKAETKELDPRVAGYLQRYVDGINYYLTTNKTPLYMQILGLKKEKWQIQDVSAISLMMTWSLAYNLKNELLYHKIAEKIGPERFSQLVHYCSPDVPTTIDDLVDPLQARPDPGSGIDITASSYGLSSYQNRNQPSRYEKNLAPLFHDFGWLLGTRSTSNAWVVSPDKTAYMGTMLVSDMQLHFSKIPNDLYFVRINAGEYQAAGVQVAGMPVIASGYNRHIAWANTNNNIDLVDLFIESIDWKKKTYRFRGSEYPLETRNEEFKVKGKNEPVAETLYYVGRRPVLTKVFPELGVDISLDWTGFDNLSYEGFFHINRAHNYDEFLRGASMLRMSPTNCVYADGEGNIGYRVIGSLPLRITGTGNLPQIGEEVISTWNGNLPDEEYPEVKNPARGFIVTANTKVVKDFPYDINPTYYAEFRYENIARMLRDRDKIDLPYAKNVQLDTHSVMAGKIIGIITRHVSIDADDSKMKKAYDTLLQWDNDVNKDSVAPALYNTFFVRFAYQTLVDELGHDLASEYVGDQRISVGRFFEMVENTSEFFDDVRTPEKESIDDIATRAFKEMLSILEKYSGSSRVEDWKWGVFHKIRFDHMLGRSDVLRPFVNYGPFPFEGDRQTNNRAAFLQIEPPFITEQASAPRLIVIFDPAPKGYMMLATGENEYFLSKHYTDMTDEWLRHEYFCIEDEEMKYKTTIFPE